MASQRQQRFSPVHSDFGDRALSPALSASSQTTASLPTDLSDVSSLDGDDEFEVIEAPLSESSEDLSMANGMDGSFDDLGVRSQMSEAASNMTNPRLNATRSQQQQQSGSSDSHHDMDESEVLPSRDSLSTLRDSSVAQDDSAASSRLQFPDPLGESFRRVEGGNDQAIRESEKEHFSSVAHTHASSSRDTHSQGEKEQHHLKKAEDKNSQPSSTTRHAPAENAPPYGFPFKIDRALLASKAFRAIVGLIIVLLASGTMPVWRPDLAPAHVASMLKKGPVTPMGTRTTRPGLPLIPSASDKTSKGLIVVKGETSRGEIASSTPAKRYKGFCFHDHSDPVPRSKELSVIVNRSSDLAVYSADSYSSLGEQVVVSSVPQVLESINASACTALEWISSTPSKISAIDLSNVKPHVFDIPTMQGLSGRLDKPSRGAKKVMNNVRKHWSSYVEELRRFTQPLAFALIHEVNALSDDVTSALRRVQPSGKELLATLQQKWEVWMTEVLRAYAVFLRVTGQEIEKVRGDVHAAFRATNKRLRKLTRDVAAVADCNRGAARRTQGAAVLRRREAQLAAFNVRQQQAVTPKDQLVARAKASLFRMAIDSGRARLLVDEALDKMICSPTRRPHNRRKTTGSRARLNIRKRKRRDMTKAVKHARRRATRLFKRG